MASIKVTNGTNLFYKDASCPINLTALPISDLLINSTLKIYEGLPHGIYISEAPVISNDIIDFINH